jgi:Holliday junction resolvase
MASTPEAKVKASVVKYLKTRGVYYFSPATHGYGRSGVPDIICCINGRFLAIECKAGTNQPTELQKREIDKIRAAKGIAAVIREDNLELVEQLVKELERE